MEDCLRHSSPSRHNPPSSVDILPGGELSDLDYTDDRVFLFDNFSDVQMLLRRMVLSSGSFGIQFAPLECKVLVQDFSVAASVF